MKYSQFEPFVHCTINQEEDMESPLILFYQCELRQTGCQVWQGSPGRTLEAYFCSHINNRLGNPIFLIKKIDA